MKITKRHLKHKND